MKHKRFSPGTIWHLIITALLVIAPIPAISSPIAAESISDYFSYSYDWEFSDTEISPGESFSLTVTGTATCNNALPAAPSQARLVSRVIAIHQTSGARKTLNSSYTVTISPVPSASGQTTTVTKVVPLQFPAGSEAGTYEVVGELIEAKLLAVIWWDILPYLPPTQSMGLVTYVVESTGGATGGGGGGGGAAPGETSLADLVDSRGIAIKDVGASSVDDKCTVVIDKGTKILQKSGYPANKISVVEQEYPQSPPADTKLVGSAYDLGPDGATFNPEIELTLAYDPKSIPTGVAEEDLVIFMWDTTSGKWIELEGCTVDTINHTITGKVAHFTDFAVLAHTGPATFTLSNLSITPAEAETGSKVTISALVANTGNLKGDYQVTFTINNVVVHTENITLDGGTSQTVSYITSQNAAGSYTVDVNGLTDSFGVKMKATPTPTPTPTSSPKPTPTPLPAPTPTPSPTPLSSQPINWPVLGGIIAVVVIGVGGIIFLILRRRTP